MIKVYDASSSAEAHMIVNLLEQSGINATVEGEYLQGALGELPASGLVRVMAPTTDYQRAREIIEKWEQVQPDIPEGNIKKTKTSFLSLAIAFFAGVGLMAYFFNFPVSENGIDYNQDGVLDAKWIYRNNILKRTEVDRNFDGKVDGISRFDMRGYIKTISMDDDFNGTFETKSFYNKGNVMSSKTDADDDGFFEYRATYKNGVLDTVSFFKPNSKTPIKIQQFKNLKLSSAKFDSNQDGKFDTFHQYDEFEEIISK